MEKEKISPSAVVDLDPSFRDYERKDGALLLKSKKTLYECVE